MENTMRDHETFEFSSRNKSMSRNILYAEDDRQMQSAIYKFLNRMGFEVALADNGFEALSLFLEGSYQLVLTDYEMPFMDGLILATNIKKKSPATPVILLTGCDSDDNIDKLEAGKSLFSSIIFKPFKMNELQNAIEGALLY